MKHLLLFIEYFLFAIVSANSARLSQGEYIDNRSLHGIQANAEYVNSGFACIGMKDLTLCGASVRDVDTINLAPGYANRAFLEGGFACAHWDMHARFRCADGFHFAMGKDDSIYGAWIEIKNDKGKAKYTLYNNGINGLYSGEYEGDIVFNFVEGETYSLHISFNVGTLKTVKFEIHGNNNEYFTYTFTDVTCNAYGNPFFYSDSECVIDEFYLTCHNYYDMINLKCAVWGHSYVEGDSLGLHRTASFMNLFADAIGDDLVLNFGLGGDTFAGLLRRMRNEMVFAHNVRYGLICVGANDDGRTFDYMKEKIEEIAALLKENCITPIFFTIPPINSKINQTFRETNAYIRNKYLYVDMEQVFLDVDAINGNPLAGDIKEDLYLGDKVHPNIEGHQLIFNRIKQDCPFLFQDSTYNKNRLIYKIDNAVYSFYNLDYGSAITPEASPEKEGYTFSGWSEIPEAMPAHDVTVMGTFSVNSYAITYMVDTQLLTTESLTYGSTIVPLTSQRDGYEIVWDFYPTTMPAYDITINGTYVTGITNIAADDADVEWYTLSGLHIETPRKGAFIMRRNGITRAIVVK